MSQAHHHDEPASSERVPLTITVIGGEPWVAASDPPSPLDGTDLELLRAMLDALDGAGHFEMKQGNDAAARVADSSLAAVEAGGERWRVVAHDQLPACPSDLAVGVYTDDNVLELRPPGLD